jgi:DNA adenine methylase
MPLMRWIGGKRRLASQLVQFAPPLDPDARYWEPFLGAASMFLRIRPRRATLGDLNNDLISCYLHIRRRPELVHRYLRPWRGVMSAARYALLRDRFNRVRNGYQRAALFLVLNKSAFNGIWRVNKRGQFNVPYNRRKHVELPQAKELKRHARVLRRATLVSGDFARQLRTCKSGDFVYLDPPYPPINGTAFFTHYTAQRFASADQERVAREIARLTRLGCRVMMSNADVPHVMTLYRGYRVERIAATRTVAAGGIRHRVSDVVVLNYAVDGALISQ